MSSEASTWADRVGNESGVRLDVTPHDPVAHSREALAVLAIKGRDAYETWVRAHRADRVTRDT